MIQLSSAPAGGARGKTGRLDVMSTSEEHILRILREANEPLFPREITRRLNREIEPGPACSSSEVMTQPMGAGCLRGRRADGECAHSARGSRKYKRPVSAGSFTF